MKIAVYLSLVVVATLVSGCDEKERQAQSRPRHVTVVAAAEQSHNATRTITGEVRARIQSDLAFRVSGRITERLVDVGTRVTTGQLLARIDPEEQKADLNIATANLQSAQAQLALAQQTFNRQKGLLERLVISQAAFDSGREALLTAEAAARSAQANLDNAKDALSHTELRADGDGIITARSAEVGQVAQAGQTVLTLAHDGPRDAVFDVYESLFLGQDLEDSVGVSLLSNKENKQQAKVREVSPTIDTASGTIRVKVGLDADQSMPLGAPVAGSFHLKGRSLVFLPWSAMASRDGKPAVWVVDPRSSTVSMRPIEVSSYETARFSTKSDALTGALVVTEGTKFLRPNETVAFDREKSQ